MSRGVITPLGAITHNIKASRSDRIGVGGHAISDKASCCASKIINCAKVALWFSTLPKKNTYSYQNKITYTQIHCHHCVLYHQDKHKVHSRSEINDICNTKKKLNIFQNKVKKCKPNIRNVFYLRKIKIKGILSIISRKKRFFVFL